MGRGRLKQGEAKRGGQGDARRVEARPVWRWSLPWWRLWRTVGGRYALEPAPGSAPPPQDRTCVAGLSCSVEAVTGLGLADGDAFAILDTCGSTAAAVPRMPQLGRPTRLLRSGAAISWGSAAATAAGGQYRLCWCAAGLECSAADAFRVDAGRLELVGVAPLVQARTCVSGRTCAVDGIKGWRIADLDFQVAAESLHCLEPLHSTPGSGGIYPLSVQGRSMICVGLINHDPTPRSTTDRCRVGHRCRIGPRSLRGRPKNYKSAQDRMRTDLESAHRRPRIRRGSTLERPDMEPSSARQWSGRQRPPNRTDNSHACRYGSREPASCSRMMWSKEENADPWRTPLRPCSRAARRASAVGLFVSGVGACGGDCVAAARCLRMLTALAEAPVLAQVAVEKRAVDDARRRGRRVANGVRKRAENVLAASLAGDSSRCLDSADGAPDRRQRAAAAAAASDGNWGRRLAVYVGGACGRRVLRMALEIRHESTAYWASRLCLPPPQRQQAPNAEATWRGRRCVFSRRRCHLRVRHMSDVKRPSGSVTRLLEGRRPSGDMASESHPRRLLLCCWFALLEVASRLAWQLRALVDLGQTVGHLQELWGGGV